MNGSYSCDTECDEGYLKTPISGTEFFTCEQSDECQAEIFPCSNETESCQDTDGESSWDWRSCDYAYLASVLLHIYCAIWLCISRILFLTFHRCHPSRVTGGSVLLDISSYSEMLCMCWCFYLGSYECNCLPGFERNLSNETCFNTDECTAGTDNCTDVPNGRSVRYAWLFFHP